MFIRKVTHAVSYLLHDRNQFLNSLLVSSFTFLPDELYLRLRYRFSIGSWPNLSNPSTYNEKLLWLKLFDRNPLYTLLVDKYAVKEYVNKRIGDKYLVKTYGLWDSPDQIDFESLPNQFVLKTTHGGGNIGVVIVKEKTKIEVEKIRLMLKKSLSQDLYKSSREWPYKNIQKRILAEEYIEDAEFGELRDYKFFCFDGKVKALFVATERQNREEPFFNFFDEDYNSLEIKQGHPVSENVPQKPSHFQEMKTIAEKLSLGFPHVRVDLYQANEKVYFGEMTFYHFGGLVPFEPSKWDQIFGSWLTLPQKTKG